LSGHSLNWRSLSWRRFSRQRPDNRWFRGGCFCGGRFCHHCRRSGYRSWTRSATTSAAATTARRSCSLFNCCRCLGWRRYGLRRGHRHRRGSRRATGLDYWSLGGNFGRRGGLVIVEPGLQGLGCFGCFLGGAVSGLLAALQALAHPFAHIAAFSTPAHTGAICAPWRGGYPGSIPGCAASRIQLNSGRRDLQ